MALVEVHVHRIPEYHILTEDIVNDRVEGLEVIGAKVYIKDTKVWKIVNEDFTLSDYVTNVTGASGGGGGSSIDRELVVTTYYVKTAFTGASVNDTITCTQVIDVTATPTQVSTIWRNQTTNLNLASAPSGSNLILVGSEAITDLQLRATPLAISDGGGSLTVDGTVASTQTGTWNIGTVSTVTNVVHIDDNSSSLTVDSTQLPSALTGSGNMKVAVQESLPTGTNSIGTVNIGTIPEIEVKNDSGNPLSITASSLPLPTGASTEATLSALNTKVTTCNTGSVTITSALPTGGNVIGKVSQQFGGADISNTNAIPTEVPCYMASTSIIRSTTVTAYAAGQILLANGATTLPAIDISAALGTSVANRRIAITSCFIMSDNGANPSFTGFVDLFNINNPSVVTSLADYAVFNPNATALASNFLNTIDDLTNVRKYGTASNLTYQVDILRKCALDGAGKLYIAPVCNSAYVPKNGEVLTVVLKFYLLN